LSTLKVIIRIFWFPILVAAIFGFIAILGYLGWEAYYQRLGIEHNISKIVYSTLQLFTLDASPPQRMAGNIKLQWAMFLAPLLVAYTAFQSIYFLLRERLQWLGRQFLKNHVIICGFGKRGEALARSFKERGYKVIVIDPAGTPGIQNRCHKAGALMLCGRAESEALLCDARLDRAKYLFAVCGDERINADIAVVAGRLSRKRSHNQLTCFIHISNWAFQRLLVGEMLVRSQHLSCRLELFNLPETAALALIREHSPFPIYPGNQTSPNHFVFVGYSPLAENFIVHFARLWWENRIIGDKFKITLAADNADQHIQKLERYYPALTDVCILESVREDDFETILKRARSTTEQFPGKIYVCPEKPTKSLALALDLREKASSLPVTIVAVVDHLDGLSTLCQSLSKDSGSAEIIVFPALDRTCGADPLLASIRERLGRAIHEEYVLQQQRSGHTVTDNKSMVPWEVLSESDRDSNRRQAEHISTKLAAAGLHIEPSTDWREQRFSFSEEEVEALARLEHLRWMQEKTASGGKYGPVKDKHKKIHPCLVPWEKLPEDEKEKDRDSIRNLPLLVGMVGFKIVRDPDKSLTV